MEEANKTKVISSDATMDCNLARTCHSKDGVSFWSADDVSSNTWQRGGSALMADQIGSLVKKMDIGELFIRQILRFLQSACLVAVKFWQFY